MSHDCPKCGKEHETLDDYEKTTVDEIGEADDGSIDVYGGKTDLYLCSGCREPMGTGHTK